MKNKKEITVFDTTLRDSSYAINFKFSKQDTENICNGLETSGISMIEVGHGLGMGASSITNGIASETDENYLLAAKETLKKAEFGAFFIPGIGTTDDLDLLSKVGANFVRIGCDITNIEFSRKYCDKAKDLGLMVFLNAMKTYEAKTSEFKKKISKISSWNSPDVFYIVDSAGCMLPHEINSYINEGKKNQMLFKYGISNSSPKARDEGYSKYIISQIQKICHVDLLDDESLDQLSQLKQICLLNRGQIPLYFHIQGVTIEAHKKYRVSSDVVAIFESILGEQKVWIEQ